MNEMVRNIFQVIGGEVESFAEMQPHSAPADQAVLREDELRRRERELELREKQLMDDFREGEIMMTMNAHPGMSREAVQEDVRQRYPMYFDLELFRTFLQTGHTIDSLRESSISSFMEVNRVSYREAMIAVSKRSPELFGLQGVQGASLLVKDILDREVQKFSESNPDATYAEALIAVSRRSPGLFNLQTDLPGSKENLDARRENKITEFMESHSDADYRTAYLEVGRQHPELFDI